MKRGVAAGHSFFQKYWLLIPDQLQPSILLCMVLFSQSSCNHPFSQGLHRADNFWQQQLIKSNYFFERLPSDFQSFKVSLFISQFCFQPSILWCRISAFVREIMTSEKEFSEGYCIYFDGRNFSLLVRIIF